MSAKALPARLVRAMRSTSTGKVGGVRDSRFRYVPAVATDISKTFRRVRAQIAKGERL